MKTNKIKQNQPATKKDVNIIVKDNIDRAKIELRKETADFKSELKGEMSLLEKRVDYRMDKLEKILAEFYAEFKDFKNRMWNLLEPLAGEVQTMRDDLVMQSGTLDRHEDSLHDHKKRLTRLESQVGV